MTRTERRSRPRLDRRKFLGAGAAASPLLAAQPAGSEASQNPRVLITSARSRLAQSLAEGLNRRYRIRLTERTRTETRFEFVECALEADAATRALVNEVDAIIHVAEPLPEDDDRQRLDTLTRGTFNLLAAAADGKTARVIYLSTLELMTPYDPGFTVSEFWRPRPGAGASLLSKHLGEYVCREFARDRKTRCVVLRLGKVVRHGEVSGFDPLWVDERDVTQAADGALKALLANTGYGAADCWRVYHIGADSPRARFSVAAAKQGLGYQPQYAW